MSIKHEKRVFSECVCKCVSNLGHTVVSPGWWQLWKNRHISVEVETSYVLTLVVCGDIFGF